MGCHFSVFFCRGSILITSQFPRHHPVIFSDNDDHGNPRFLLLLGLVHPYFGGVKPSFFMVLGSKGKGCFFITETKRIGIGSWGIYSQFRWGELIGSPEVEPATDRPTKVEATCPESTWPVACESAPRNGALQEDKVRSVGNDMQGSGMKLYWSYIFWAVTKTLGWLFFLGDWWLMFNSQ